MMILREQILKGHTVTYLVYIQVAITYAEVDVESRSDANRGYERFVTACA
jgi:hypothetical protein